MSTLARGNGIVLRRVRHGESSLILTVFTVEHGKVGLIAKGARSKSKLGSSAGLELLSEAQFVYYHKPGRDLHILKEWSVANTRIGLRSDLKLIAVGSAVVELIGRALREEDPHPGLYDEAVRTLNALDDRPPGALPLLWRFEIALLTELGFALRLTNCCQSGRELLPPFHGEVRYRLSDGSFLHPETEPMAATDGALSPDAFAVISALPRASAALAGRLSANPRVQHEVTTFLAKYLETHLPIRGRLHSLDALSWGKVAPST